jgi:hypothetical protein
MRWLEEHGNGVCANDIPFIYLNNEDYQHFKSVLGT